MHFPDKVQQGFPGTLGLAENGILEATGPLPDTLLATRVVQGVTQLGELDRTLLRAPVAGRVRFEPYYVYRWEGASFKPVGTSGSGRLLIQQPALRSREQDPADPTDTKVFKDRLFVFEHVDRTEVATLLHSSLVLQLRFLEGIVTAAEPRLTIPKTTPELESWVLSGVNNLLRAWTAFISEVSWSIEDLEVGDAVPVGWRTGFPPRAAKTAAADIVVQAVRQVLAEPDWLASLLRFSQNIYSFLLAGHSWLEVLLLNGQDPKRPRFPVSSDREPYTPRDDAGVLQHERLRLIEDPQSQWIACYAGCPIGKPSRVYAPAPGVGEAFPSGGLTTYEVEVLHAAGTAHTALGMPTPVDVVGPLHGWAMNLAGYLPKARGRAGFFTAERLGSDLLHTTADWLVELTRGVHNRFKEEGFLDLFALMDPADGRGHPLLAALHADEHLRAVHLRRQLDALNHAKVDNDKGVDTESIDWWDEHLGFDKVAGEWHHVRVDGKSSDAPPSPQHPYRPDDTWRPDDTRRLAGVLTFMELIFGNPTGWDTFDLTSAYLARARMSSPADSGGLPLPVLLALMEREGVALFAPLNRNVRNVRSETEAALVWESLTRDPARGPKPKPRTAFPDADSQMARVAWLSFPYGLDTFAKPATDAGVNAVVAVLEDHGVLELELGEDLAAYFRTRVFASFFKLNLPAPLAALGTPRIWKLSRRAHWAGLSFMAGFFRHLEAGIAAPTVANKFAEPGEPGWKPDSGWLPAGSSPPSLAGVGPADPEWKDYISYYAMIYVAYNAGEKEWRGMAKNAEKMKADGSPLSLRDILLFKSDRLRFPIGNMGRFAAGLDALLRVDYLEGRTPDDYAAAQPDTRPVSGRAWGV